MTTWYSAFSCSWPYLYCTACTTAAGSASGCRAGGIDARLTAFFPRVKPSTPATTRLLAATRRARCLHTNQTKSAKNTSPLRSLVRKRGRRNRKEAQEECFGAVGQTKVLHYWLTILRRFRCWQPKIALKSLSTKTDVNLQHKEKIRDDNVIMNCL